MPKTMDLSDRFERLLIMSGALTSRPFGVGLDARTSLIVKNEHHIGSKYD